MLRGIEEGLSDRGYTLLVRTIEDAEDRDRAFDQCCTRSRADGVLALWLSPPESFVERMVAEQFPVVLLNVSNERLWSVGVDHDASARAAVDYCFNIGHRRIALVDRPLDAFDTASSGLRERGYRDAMVTADLPIRDGYEQKAQLSLAEGASAVQRLFELPQPPTAIVAASEVQAIGVLQAARDRDWQVPGDLSVVGYSDSQYAEYLGLTTIDVPARDIGREATQVLLGTLRDPASAPRSIYQPTRLVVRRTCGPPKP